MVLLMFKYRLLTSESITEDFLNINGLVIKGIDKNGI